MLEIRALRTGYGSFEVLHEVALSVPEHHIVTLLGHNGAGKSTLLKAVSGQMPVWAGEVLFKGEPLHGLNSAATARRGIRYVPQEGHTFPGLPIEDNLRLGAHSAGDNRELLAIRMEEVYTMFPILRERRRAPARVLSGGERQMLAISMALMTAPLVLLLDEPSAGLAPILVQRVFDAIARMRDDLGTTVLLVEQNVTEALRLASETYVMQEGRIIFNAPSSERDAIIHHLWGLARAAEVAEGKEP